MAPLVEFVAQRRASASRPSSDRLRRLRFASGDTGVGPKQSRAWHLWSSSSRSAVPRPRSRSPRRLSRRLHGVTRRNASSAEYRLLALRRVTPRIRRTEPLRVAQLATRHAAPLPHHMLNPFKPPQQPLINSTRPTASWGMQLLLSSLTGRRRAKMLRRKTRLVEGEAMDAGAEGCFGAMRSAEKVLCISDKSGAWSRLSHESTFAGPT